MRKLQFSVRAYVTWLQLTDMFSDYVTKISILWYAVTFTIFIRDTFILGSMSQIS